MLNGRVNVCVVSRIQMDASIVSVWYLELGFFCLKSTKEPVDMEMSENL